MIGGTAMASFFVLSEENDTMKREGGGDVTVPFVYYQLLIYVTWSMIKLHLL